MKKMKVIDLLNKIANGEQPQKIAYDDIVFEWSQVGMFGGNYYKKYDFTPLNVYASLSAPDILNREVEVIE